MSDESSPRIINLDHLAYLVVSGNDATKFLHAQFTNDLESLPVLHWQYTGYCTPKGRLLAFMIALKRGENDYLLIMDNSVMEKFQPRLSMFVMRDDVSIVRGEAGLRGVLQALPEEWKDAHSPVPEPGEASCHGNNCLLAIDAHRWLVIDETGSSKDAASDSDSWIRQDILAGIPTVTSATQEAFVPQMVNLDLIGAVNFKKGCYPGQEVVARVHYLGKIKQRMFYATIEEGGDVSAGDPVYSAAQPDKAAGTIVSVVADGGTALLAVLQTKAVASGESLRLGSQEGPLLTLQKLPYPIPDLAAGTDDTYEADPQA